MNIRRWGSPTLSSPVTRIWKRRTAAELVMPALPLASNASQKRAALIPEPFGETIGGDKRQ